MRLTEEDALRRLAVQDHGILSTVHAQRGVDAVPVVYALDDDGYVGIPIDRVKEKATTRLQREVNLDLDPRATLLVEHWDRDDWSRLWWVRVELRRQTDADHRATLLGSRLVERYHQYRGVETIARVLVLRIVDLSGWAAAGGTGADPSATGLGG